MDKIRSITGNTSLVGVIGWPVRHSFSPRMHNAAFTALKLDWAYVPLPVQPGQVQQALRGLATLNFIGVNVTLPHKQTVVPYMDELSDTARATGSVNTIHLHKGKLWGHNTDIIGILNSLGEAGCYPQGMRVVVLGAGGVARSVVFALAQAKAETVLILNRTTEHASSLVDKLVGLFPKKSALTFAPLTTETLVDLQNEVDLVVNSTSVGMQPHYDTCPWPKDAPMPAKITFCDLVYTPLETMFLAHARAAGGKTIDGLGMLVHQGAAAFEIWTGYYPPIHVMRQACLDQLEDN